MSFPWMPPIYNIRGRTTQWMNSIVSTHETFCGCDKPFYHLIYELQKNNGFHQITTEEEKLIKKCLGIPGITTADASTDTNEKENQDVDDLDVGDLERLFAEDGEEDTQR